MPRLVGVSCTCVRASAAVRDRYDMVMAARWAAVLAQQAAAGSTMRVGGKGGIRRCINSWAIEDAADVAKRKHSRWSLPN